MSKVFPNIDLPQQPFDPPPFRPRLVLDLMDRALQIVGLGLEIESSFRVPWTLSGFLQGATSHHLL